MVHCADAYGLGLRRLPLRSPVGTSFLSHAQTARGWNEMHVESRDAEYLIRMLHLLADERPLSEPRILLAQARSESPFASWVYETVQNDLESATNFLHWAVPELGLPAEEANERARSSPRRPRSWSCRGQAVPPRDHAAQSPCRHSRRRGAADDVGNFDAFGGQCPCAGPSWLGVRQFPNHRRPPA